MLKSIFAVQWRVQISWTVCACVGVFVSGLSALRTSDLILASWSALIHFVVSNCFHACILIAWLQKIRSKHMP